MESHHTHNGFTHTLNVPLRGAREIPTARLVSGFTLIEMLVVLGIIGFIMSIVMTSQSTFNKTLILKNAAYDIALTLRAAETYGMGNRATVGNVKNAGYGVHFQSGVQGSFILFADTSPAGSPGTTPNCPSTSSVGAPDCEPGDHLYNAPGLVDTPMPTYNLNNGITISDFCAYASGIKLCASDSGISSLDIVFARPNPDVFISVGGSSFTNYTKACIKVTSLQGGVFVSVTSSGQITANAAPSSCP